MMFCLSNEVNFIFARNLTNLSSFLNSFGLTTNIFNFLLLNQHHNLFFLFFIDLLSCEISKFQLLCDRDQKKITNQWKIMLRLTPKNYIYQCVLPLLFTSSRGNHTDASALLRVRYFVIQARGS